MVVSCCSGYFNMSRHFFFVSNHAPPVIYSLSLHDALPISQISADGLVDFSRSIVALRHQGLHVFQFFGQRQAPRSEEHTSELQSRRDLVCRLLLEKKKLENLL